MKPATTVTKLCRVMEQFQERQSFGITDLARRTELLPSDVHRILTSLRAFGYIEQDPETRKYRLGFSLLRLGLTVFRRNQLREKAHPVLVRLSQKIAAATYLALLDERESKVLMVDQVEGPNDPVFTDHLGGSERLHCTALGKIIMANVSRDIALSALEKSSLTRFTRHTITDISTLEQQFEEIRRLGYAVDREEYTNGVCCLASPAPGSRRQRGWRDQHIDAIFSVCGMGRITLSSAIEGCRASHIGPSGHSKGRCVVNSARGGRIIL